MTSETVSETLDYKAILTCLIAREDFIAYSRRESLKFYTYNSYPMVATLRNRTCCRLASLFRSGFYIIQKFNDSEDLF
jgi:hypothetical protein